MSIIPLHLQRRFEQRWAAKFAPRVASATPKNIGLNDTTNRLPSPAKEKEKPAGLVSGLSQRWNQRGSFART
jgi:predicted nucleic acid-binding Zn ribbon protein